MAVQFHNGQVLFDGGKVAMHADCCCCEGCEGDHLWDAGDLPYSDGDTFDTWPDSIGGVDLSAGSNEATYRGSYLNGHPIVEIDGRLSFACPAPTYYDAGLTIYGVTRTHAWNGRGQVQFINNRSNEFASNVFKEAGDNCTFDMKSWNILVIDLNCNLGSPKYGWFAWGMAIDTDANTFEAYAKADNGNTFSGTQTGDTYSYRIDEFRLDGDGDGGQFAEVELIAEQIDSMATLTSTVTALATKYGF